MARGNAVIVVSAAMLAFAAGLVIGRNIDRGESDLRDSAGNSLVSPLTRRAADSPRLPFQNVRRADAPRPALAEAAADEGPFAYQRLRLDTSESPPKACFEFNRQLDPADTNYGDFVAVTPKAKIAAVAAGESLCLAGFDFAKDYEVALRRGLPSADGATLGRSERVVVAFGDKPAYVGFAGDGVILPRLDADGLGVETVNVGKVRLVARRVSDRSLVRKRIVTGAAVAAGRYGDAYGEDDGADVGAVAFDETIDVDGARNETTTTVFPFGAALPNLKPGAYFVRLEDASPGADPERPASAWRWILHTDLALSAYSSDAAIDVVARSLQTGRPLIDVELQIVARNNDVLARATTNADGAARFERLPTAPGPLSPRMVMAYGPQQDFAALDLARAPLDLSRYPVGGRDAARPVDAFVYLDRGVYRPGETMRLSTLLRDEAGRADARPMTLVVSRPNGVEALRKRIEPTELGSFSLEYDLPRSAPRGSWSARVEAGGAGTAGAVSFAVEDFVPQRIEVALDTDETTPLVVGDARSARIEARYLYGAPAADLAVEAEARLRVDPNPFPSRPGYRYGPVEGRFAERILPLASTTTDADGLAETTIEIDPNAADFAAPLRVDVVVGVVEPGGRAVRESARLPVRHKSRYVGVKLEGDATRVGLGETAMVEAVLLDRNGEPNRGELEWRLVEEDYWFEWYRQGGEWRWRRAYRDVLKAEGRARPAEGADIVRIARKLEPGSYRVSVRDPESGAASDLRFYVGWRSNEAAADSPDAATLSVVSEAVAPGARAKLYLDPPYAGEAMLVIATDRVREVRRFKVEAGGQEIVVDTKPEWGAGFYALASVVTPRNAAGRPTPRRAMGVAHVPFEMAERTLDVAITNPAVARPRERLDLPVTIAGLGRGERAMLTLAAVDEGILRLTKFETPDPVAHFFGKKRLGVEVRDDYGRILDPNLGAPTNFGGDQIGGEGLTSVPTKSIALFSGPVEVDAEGRALVSFDAPDFNGELRLMAVAWTSENVGGADAALTVRDPAPTLLSLPRFLAPGDTARADLLVDNVDGVGTPIAVAVTGASPIEADATFSLDLAAGEQARRAIDVAADAAGVGALELSVADADGRSLTRASPLQARAPFYPTTSVSVRRLEPGETLALDDSLAAPFLAGAFEGSASFSPIAGVDPGPIVDQLSRYPYGCSEQLVSTATPLLYADAFGLEASDGVRPRVQEAVNKLLDRQGPDGAFGLWRVGDGRATGWLGAYVTDFLARARADGYAAPESALSSAYDALAKVARLDRWAYVAYRRDVYTGPDETDTAQRLRRRSAAYALYVLARADRASLSDLRYFHDAVFNEIESPLARAHVGAALARMGDAARAANAFDEAIARLGWDNKSDYYQSPLRDAAAVLALIVESGDGPRADAAAARLAELTRDPETMNTQEQAFSLIAAEAMLQAAGAVVVSRDGQDLEAEGELVRVALTPTDLADGVRFRNDGSGPVYASVAAGGPPREAPPAVDRGYAAAKRVFTLSGEEVPLADGRLEARQNDRLVVAVSGTAGDKRTHPTVVADLLPAGFEIEAILRPEDGAPASEAGRRARGPYAWLGPISRGDVAEARDDRFVAALDVRDRPFTFAYVVRAVTPGDFAFPGVVVEDMYRPGVFGRTAAARLRVAPAAP
ncbi:MAG: alpha-2-macroglobulin [Parvularculaceae bacterium]